MLLAIRSFFPATERSVKTRVFTEKRGNESLLNKLMTSKFPLSAGLMEFSEQLRHTGVRPDVRWAPREINLEADRFANGNFHGFSVGLRIRPLPPSPDWYILGEALVMGKEAEQQKITHRAQGDVGSPVFV